MALFGGLVAVLAADTTEKVVSSNLTVRDWIVAVAILVGGVAAGQLGRTLLVRAVRSDDEEEPLAVRVVGRIVTTIAMTAGVLYALAILGVRLGPLVGALGIGGLAIAFASQSILANFLSSVILQVRRPFRHGDWVETNGCEGTMEAINFRTVVLRTLGGERVMVPCAEVVSKPITNYSALGRRRTSIDIGIGYDSDLAVARDALLKAIAAVDGVRGLPPPEVWVHCFGDSSIGLVMRFWHAPDPMEMYRVRNDVAIAAKRALDEAGIDMPYPQRVLHFAASGRDPTFPPLPSGEQLEVDADNRQEVVR